MSWDIFAQDLPQDAKSIGDIPADFSPRLIGKRTLLIEKIKEVVPAANFSDPAWGVIEGDSFSIEVNIGNQEDCRSIAFHVRGGEPAPGVVAAILEHLKLRALDTGTGEFFTPGPEASASFSNWRKYRNQIAAANPD